MPHRSAIRPHPLVALVAGLAFVVGSGFGGRAELGTTAVAEFHPVVAIARSGAAVDAGQSTNWSGYNRGFLEHRTRFGAISAEWRVPRAVQHRRGQEEASATWIGIGGGCLNTSCTSTDSTLIQAGTEQDVAASGAASYSTWWEIIPGPSVSTTLAVRPGDVVRVNIILTKPGVWRITISNLSRHKHFTTTVPYSSSELTAEWIVETPLAVGTSGAGVAALPKLTTVHFSRATVNGVAAHLRAAEALQLVDANNRPIATPSRPDRTGARFNDCTWASSCPTPR